MLGLYTTGRIPFKDVYIHGLVLAEGGAKMSKSLGNVVEAMEIVASQGSDALRMGLLAGRAPAVNRGYDRRRVEEARNFCNKLWNVARYAEAKIGNQHSGRSNAQPQSIADHWILRQLDDSVKEMSKFLVKYRLSEAYETLYHFVWNDLADWYIEATKTSFDSAQGKDLNPAFLAYVLESTLKLAHPFAPFVTETIWQTLAWDDSSFLMTQNWPKVMDFDNNKAAEFEGLKAGISEIRQIISRLELKKPKLVHDGSQLITQNKELVSGLAGLGAVEQGRLEGGLKLINARTDTWLDIDQLAAQGYLLKLSRQKQELEQTIKTLQNRLNNPSYTQKAPQELVDQTRSQLDNEKSKLAIIESDIANFEKSIN